LEQFQIHHRLVKWRILDQRSADDKILPYGYSTQEAFSKFDLQHIVRENNERVNLLSKLASTKKKNQHRTVIKVVASVTPIDQEQMTKIWDFLEKGSLLKNPTATQRLKRNASYYVIGGGDLYKKSFIGPLLKCLTRDQSKYVMNEMRRGICGMHSGSQSMSP